MFVVIDEQQIFYRLGAALAVGLLIGVERGWKERAMAEGTRVAGLRTYGLLGMLGGGVALIAEQLGTVVLGLAFIAVAGVMTAAYVANLQRGDDVSITGLVAGLLSFVFGALAGLGEVAAAGAAAVVTTLLLGFKPVLHRWVGGLEEKELRAGIKLLLISVVLLPVLPNQGYGPWQVLNPYAIWWMVVLIAAISFAGYFAVKIAGARKGTMFTGLFAGLASSTALTLHFSRLAKMKPEMAPMLATGILLACGTMFPRMVLVASFVNRDLALWLLAPAAVMALVVYGTALVYWRRLPRAEAEASARLENPLELSSAVSFGALLALVIVLAEALKVWWGDIGVFLLALASGVADVDAVTLSLARMSQADLTLRVAVMGIVIAGAANSAVKGAIAAAVGGRSLGVRVVLPLVGAAAAGPLVAWGWLW